MTRQGPQRLRPGRPGSSEEPHGQVVFSVSQESVLQTVLKFEESGPKTQGIGGTFRSCRGGEHGG